MRCPKCGAPLACLSCQNAKAGRVTSAAKAKAARENGKKGGRPRKKEA